MSVEEHRGELGSDPAGIAALESVVVLELARVAFAQKNRDLSTIGTQELDRGCHHGVEQSHGRDGGAWPDFCGYSGYVNQPFSSGAAIVQDNVRKLEEPLPARVLRPEAARRTRGHVMATTLRPRAWASDLPFRSAER